uniref:P26 n=1 Tax=Ash shoestring-associated virus TaxID=3070173 RepID=A0A8J9RY05_9VIRU|nr:P26 [Ash shoestring-associated virus]
MSPKAFEKTFKICSSGDIDVLYSEMERMYFYGMMEKLPKIETYDEIMTIREAHEDKNFNIGLVTATMSHIEVDETIVSQKAIRYYLRYLQFVYSLFNIQGVLGEDLSSDFYIFGALVKGNRILPYIPDNTKILLIQKNLIDQAIWEVVKGMDPVGAIERALIAQPKEATYNEITVVSTMHVMAITYIAMRSTQKVGIEKDACTSDQPFEGILNKDFHLSTKKPNVSSASTS